MSIKRLTPEQFIALATYHDGVYWLNADGGDVIVTVPQGADWEGYGLRGSKNGSITVDGAGIGFAIRDGSGYGDAIRRGNGKIGSALRYGTGGGYAIHTGSGAGDAIRRGNGGGCAFRR